MGLEVHQLPWMFCICGTAGRRQSRISFWRGWCFGGGSIIGRIARQPTMAKRTRGLSTEVKYFSGQFYRHWGNAWVLDPADPRLPQYMNRKSNLLDQTHGLMSVVRLWSLGGQPDAYRKPRRRLRRQWLLPVRILHQRILRKRRDMM